jgi:peptidoglycan/LPS O-acetylase OafA/YrhL
MPVRSSTSPATDGGPQASRSPRWHSLDVLKGLALWAMIAHHFQSWAGGQVDGRIIGFDHFVVTDLAPPLFTVGVGAAAVAVGSRIDRWEDLRQPVWHWIEIFLLGLAIDLATHGAIEGTGVLPTLAILGLAVTLAVAAGLRQPWAWWIAAAGCAVVAVPATDLAGSDPLRLLVNGPFALPVYGVFTAAGAAVASHALGQSERALPLIRATVGVLVVGLLAGTLAGGVVAPSGLWPPDRYPGHLAFTLWGLVASLAVWAAARELLPSHRALGRAVARAGRRTLPIFAAHFVVKIALRQAGLLGDLDTWRWGVVTWLAVAAVCAASTIPRRHPSRP